MRPRRISLLFCLALAFLVIVPLVLAQPPTFEEHDPENDFTTEVRLNKPGVTFDLALLNESGVDLTIVEDRWVGGVYYLYRSHHDQDLGVILYDTAVTYHGGLSVSLAIPTEWVNDNLVPTVDLDPSKLDWEAAMTTELDWLIEKSVVSGLGSLDIQEIAEQTGPGYAGRDSRIVYYDGSWMPQNETDLIMLLPPPGTGFVLDNNDLPPRGIEPVGDDDLNYAILIIVGALVVVLVVGVFAYTRLKRRNLLDNLNRKNIFEHIKANPGIHFNAMRRDLNFKPGALSYHLNVLEKGDFIKSTQDGNYRRYYLFGVKSDLKIALTSMQLRILSIVDERPGISQSKIAKTVGRNRILINYHVRILADADILSIEKDGRENLCYVTSNSEHYLPG